MTAQHTPGPWRIEPDPSQTTCRVYGKGRKPGQHKQHVAEVWSGDDRTMEVTEANARLIAAGPEMDETLTAALEAIGPLLDTDPNGEKYPELWELHANICQLQDRITGRGESGAEAEGRAES